MHSSKIFSSSRGQGNNGEQEINHVSPEELITMHGVETLICGVIFQNTQVLRVAHANAITNEQCQHDADALADISIH